VCRKRLAQCLCKRAPAVPVGDAIVRVSRDSKGRGGKAVRLVRLVRGVLLDAYALTALGKQLKTARGSGGTVKDGVIKVQGDHIERVVEAIRARGFVVKRARG